ncbi:hypothetical protein GE061_012883 [Apolygus lucorum]|uniref:Uncharacterized protein n=1 Tax=Apolygus lucorum TaxID=248454 RepID=A0A6A4JMP7_APOLU|nr:hypothetical protein GE061_012883 [Apolygus lucorum]
MSDQLQYENPRQTGDENLMYVEEGWKTSGGGRTPTHEALPTQNGSGPIARFSPSSPLPSSSSNCWDDDALSPAVPPLPRGVLSRGTGDVRSLGELHLRGTHFLPAAVHEELPRRDHSCSNHSCNSNSRTPKLRGSPRMGPGPIARFSLRSSLPSTSSSD